jgi:hypothetical protein
MPAELLSAIPGLVEVVNKAGVIGLLLLAVGWLIRERLRLIKQGAKSFRQRDRWRQIAERYRGAILAAGALVPDIADIDREFAADKEQEA